MRIYHVLWWGRGDMSTLATELKRLNAATPVLKQRGTGLDLEALRKKLKGKGTENFSVAFYPVGKSIRAVIVKEVG
jgi:hypothetical protein